MNHAFCISISIPKHRAGSFKFSARTGSDGGKYTYGLEDHNDSPKNLMYIRQLLLGSFGLGLLGFDLTAAPLGTAFTYQGLLQDSANAANGLYDLSFAVYDAASGGNQVGPTLTNSAVGVTNGVFTVMLDFGSNVFAGQALWLESAVRPKGAAAFALLPPREPLTPAPYALYAARSGSAFQGFVQATNIDTRSDQALELSVNGYRALRLEPTDSLDGPNVIAGYGGLGGNFVAAGVAGATIGGGGAVPVTLPSGTRLENNNRVTANYGVVAGGLQNVVSGEEGVVSGGQGNMVGTQGGYGVVPGGDQNLANGQNSFAAGHRAKANHDGSFVWADSSDADFSSTGTNQFLVRAGGGVGINTGNPKATLHMASGGATELRFASTASGAGDWSWGTGWTGAGRRNVYLYDHVAAATRLLVDDSGKVGIGTSSPTDALLEVEGNVRVSDHDLFLRGGSDRYHGLGWYGAGKPFGNANPDGPVLYGNVGGALGTTVNGNQPALSWDTNRVTVAKDLQVNGNLKLIGTIDSGLTPAVNWDQYDGTFPLDPGFENVLLRCSTSQAGPGFFVIVGYAYAEGTYDTNYLYFFLDLVDDTNPTNPVTLASTICDTGLLGDPIGSVSLSWVVPIATADAGRTFTLYLLSPDDYCTLLDANLTVMFFPRRINGSPNITPDLSPAQFGPATRLASVASPSTPGEKGWPGLRSKGVPPPRRLGRLQDRAADLQAKDNEIEALKRRLDRLERLVGERSGGTQ